MEQYPELNEFQTPIEDLHLDKEPQEIKEQFLDLFYNVPFIQNLTSIDRKRAKDLPRDDKGRIIVDITKPHILEDMDYFRPAAIYFQKNGCYTKLRPNSNPNSEYGKWCMEEARRCREGYVRESDGEWIPGDYYFFLNYCPMQLVKKEDKKSKKGKRVFDFPKVWEGHYLKAHALQQAREQGHHYAELASRSKGKSFYAAAMLAKRFVLGESKEVNKKVVSYITADDRKYLTGGDQTLDKFQFDVDWIANNMQWPSKRLINSLSNMQWIMGYKDIDSGTNQGTLNSVIGVTSKDDPQKLRGTRGVLYVIEEMGTFPALLDLIGNLRPSVEEGEDVFGTIIAYGTSSDKESDFTSAQEIVYNPEGYNFIAFDNVFDKLGQGKKKFAFFFPGYVNMANHYEETNGVSDVTGALLSILKDRYWTKYHVSNPAALTKRIAEIPVTPQEAMLRTRGNLFPVTQLNDRLNELDNNPNSFDDVYIGRLVQDKTGTVKFVPTDDTPIRDFPTKDNKEKGAIEIYEMPQKDAKGNVFQGRYILGHDPVDNDAADTMSLTSTFVLDLFTDRIVAEYTGRQDFADDNFEIVRLLCLFYNGKCLFESNKKGIFAYFSTRRCLHLLADTPEYLKDKQIIKEIGYGNNSKGVNATKPVNDYANALLRDWFLKPVPVTKKDENGEEYETTVPNLAFVKSRALLKEAVMFNPEINVDRIRAMGMVMLYRGQFIDLYEGDMSRAVEEVEDPAWEDAYFKAYDEK